MNDFFFLHFKIFLLIIFTYILIKQTVYSNFAESDELFQNMLGISITALMMTTFEVLFVWINYYFAINNSGVKLIDETTTTIVDNIKKEMDPNDDTSKNNLNIIKQTFISTSNATQSIADLDRHKTNTINMYTDLSGFLLLSIVIVLIYAIYQSGKANGHSVKPKTLYTAFITGIFLILFFGYSYFSIHSKYKMIPNDFDILKIIRKSLGEEYEPEKEMSVNPFSNINVLFSEYTGKLLIFLIFINVALFFNSK